MFSASVSYRHKESKSADGRCCIPPSPVLLHPPDYSLTNEKPIKAEILKRPREFNRREARLAHGGTVAVATQSPLLSV